MKSMARLKEYYKENVVPAMSEKFKYGNPNQIPRMVKIVVNLGVGEGSRTPELIKSAHKELGTITGQLPKNTKARKSEANFKLREGMDVGTKVTLRGKMMWEFLDRLVNVALPRIRDFRGLNPKAFDGRGNYNMGVQEQIVFPEVDYDNVEAVRGMDIAITTTATNNEQGRALLEAFNFPFKK